MIVRLVKLAVSILVWGCDLLKRGVYGLLGIRYPGRSVVLYYHAVNREDRGRFARQMDDVLRLAKPVPPGFTGTVEMETLYASITFDDGFVSVIENALPELLKREIPFAIFVPSGFMGRRPEWTKNARYCRQIVMDKYQLSEIGNMKLATIGSHCVTHSNLLSLGMDAAREEIYRSKKDLEAALNYEVEFICFPHGAYDNRHVELARGAGYSRIFTINPVLAFKKPDEYVTGRFSVEPSDWGIEFRLKLIGAYRWLPAAFLLKRKIRRILGHPEKKNAFKLESEIDGACSGSEKNS